MKKRSAFAILVVISILLTSCGTPPAVVTVPTDTVASPSEPTATAPASQQPQATATQGSSSEITPTTAAPPAQGGSPYDNYLFASIDDYQKYSGQTISQFAESPSMTDLVNAGKLPPLDQRLPKDVAVIKTREGSAAKFGGEINLVGIMEGNSLFTTLTEDMQQGLTTVDVDYRTHPNIAKDWKLSDDMKTLTLYLREGMKWSDGDDFTADDFVFWYEDVLQNTELNPEVDPAFTPGGQSGE